MRNFLFLILAIAVAIPSIADISILGEWTTENGKSKVEIYECGKKICARIVWLNEPSYPEGDSESGKPKRDRYNPDQTKNNDPIVGLQIMKNFEKDGENTWKKGTIYDPENGKTYKCIITLSDSNTLKVRGYIGFSLIGRTTVWTRK